MTALNRKLPFSVFRYGNMKANKKLSHSGFNSLLIIQAARVSDIIRFHAVSELFAYQKIGWKCHGFGQCIDREKSGFLCIGICLQITARRGCPEPYPDGLFVQIMKI